MNEVTITQRITINNQQGGGEINWQGPGPQQINGNMAGNAGPVPGAQFVSHHGTKISFGGLAIPGYGIIKNLDTAYDCHYGVWVPGSVGKGFTPFKLSPGEWFPFHLSEFLPDDWTGGSGTGSADAVQLWVIAMNPAGQWVDIEAFEH